MSATATGLIADIGATNTRLALVEPDGAVTGARVYASEDFASLREAITAYLAAEAPAKPVKAVLAVAAPVTGDRVTLTNHPWTFSAEDLRRHFGFAALKAINDFTANALAVPHLAESDRAQVGGGAAVADAPIGVIGPGSGLGISTLIPDGGLGIPLQGEGGHVTMAPADAREAAVLDLMRKRFDHVSAERVLSGPGLINLYNALCELAGERAAPLTPAQITDAGIEDEHPRARDATAMFYAMLGTVAGNLALTVGARGGVYIAGGIVPKLGQAFAQSAFRARFEAKGRMHGFMAAIPTYVITHPEPALLGAAKLVGRM
jgi:glucokinase